MSIKLKSLLLLVLFTGFALLNWNCEKDDICDPITPVTPHLVISFFGVDDNLPRTFSKLALINESLPATDTLIFTAANTIAVPLNLSTDEVEFSFILNYDNPDPQLIYSDVIKFNYSRKNEYVSRACGYKTTFELNNSVDLPSPFLLNGNFPLIPGSWIKNILIENYSIISENETHVEIYY